jgi:hypothetical protein
MTTTLRTPSSTRGTNFEFDISALNPNQIKIISRNGTEFFYHLDALRDLYLWLKDIRNGEWVELGTKNENEIPNAGTVEEWARSESNPIGDFYGLTPRFRGRFATFVPPILEFMGFVEVEHNPNNNRMRALPVR